MIKAFRFELEARRWLETFSKNVVRRFTCCLAGSFFGLFRNTTLHTNVAQQTAVQSIRLCRDEPIREWKSRNKTKKTALWSEPLTTGYADHYFDGPAADHALSIELAHSGATLINARPIKKEKEWSLSASFTSFPGCHGQGQRLPPQF